MKRELVVAYGQNREIGQGGDMPWRRDMPADLRHFMKLTRGIGKAVVMGYNTYRSIGRPLAERDNIVVASRSRRLPCGVTKVPSLEAAYEYADQRQHSELFVIGGAMLYAAALETDTIDVVHATEIQAEFPGADTFFPPLPEGFVETSRESHLQDERNRFDYDFVTLADQSRQ